MDDWLNSTRHPIHMPRTLFFLSIIHCELEFGAVVEYCIAQGYDVYVVVGWVGPSAERTGDKYRGLGAQVEFLPDSMAYGDPQAGAAESRKEETDAETVKLAPPPKSAIARLRGFASAARSAWRTRAAARRLIARIRPNVIITGADHSCGRFHNALHLKARQQAIPIAVIPYNSNVSTSVAIRSAFIRMSDNMVAPEAFAAHGILNPIFARLFPRWTRQSGDVSLFRFDPLDTIAARLFGLVEHDPWEHPSHRVDLFLAPTAHAMTVLETSGFPMQKARLAGMPRMDAIIARWLDPAYRNEVMTKLSLSQGQPFILWNMEPGWEHRYMTAQAHWELVKSTATVLRETGLPVVVALHPLCHEANYRFLEAMPGFVISRGLHIYDVMPAAKVIVSFLCSTNIVANALGCDLIIYDRYRRAVPDGMFALEHRLPDSTIVYDLEELGQAVKAAARASCAPPTTVLKRLAAMPACPKIDTMLRELAL